MERHEVASLLDMFCNLLLPFLTSQLTRKHLRASRAAQSPSQQLLHLFQLIVKRSEAGSLWVTGEKAREWQRILKEN